MRNSLEKISGLKSRIRLFLNEARESNAARDHFNAAFCLAAAAEFRAKIATVKAGEFYLFDVWTGAELTWMAEIKRAYPRGRAGDIRYLETGKGAPGSLLRAAHDAWLRAGDAWWAASIRDCAFIDL